MRGEKWSRRKSKVVERKEMGGEKKRVMRKKGEVVGRVEENRIKVELKKSRR